MRTVTGTLIHALLRTLIDTFVVSIITRVPEILPSVAKKMSSLWFLKHASSLCHGITVMPTALYAYF